MMAHNCNFQILPHPADLKIQVFGKTKEELFANALKAMAQILTNYKIPTLNNKIKKKIKINSTDLNALLVDFLSEVLYQTQIQKAVYFEINFLKFSDSELKAEISGRKVDHFEEEIKAVTYHNLKIKKNPQGFFEARILFDI